ncbi:MAG: ferritin [Gemmatimonadota bacterium]|nr:ferritin [Gemmatimonadota bacterium]
MFSKTIQEALNKQIQHEFSAAYSYLAMCAYFEDQNFSGFAKWCRTQYEEEIAHGMRLFDFVHTRGGRVKILGIEEPATDFASPLDVFEKALKQEMQVTKLIYDLYELSQKERDYGTQVELQWFITEQIEEEDTFEAIIQSLKLAGDNRAALLLLDRQMGERPASPE